MLIIQSKILFLKISVLASHPKKWAEIYMSIVDIKLGNLLPTASGT